MNTTIPFSATTATILSSDVTSENNISDDVTSPDDVTSTTPTTTSSSSSVFVSGALETVSLEALYYFHVVYFSLAIALGVPGNVIVVAAYGNLKSKSSCDWYIMYIGVLDLIICLFRVPTHLAMETGHWQRHGTDALCKCVYWLAQSVTSASVFLFGFIAIDRYIKVCRSATVISAKFSRNSIALISLCSLVFALPTLWIFANNDQGKCVVVPSRLGFSFVKAYYTFLFASFILMFLIVVVCYTVIIVKARRSRQAVKLHRKGLSQQNSWAQRGRRSGVMWRRRRRRNNKVGVSQGEGEGGSGGDGGGGGGCGGQGVSVGRRLARQDPETHARSSQQLQQEQQEQEEEELSLSAMVRRLRNPMGKYLGDVCLRDSRPSPTRPVRASSTESSLVTESWAQGQRRQEASIGGHSSTAVRLIPRAPTRTESSDINVLQIFSLPGTSPSSAARDTAVTLSFEENNAAGNVCSSGSAGTSVARSLATTEGEPRRENTYCDGENEDTNVSTLNVEDTLGLPGKTLSSVSGVEQGCPHSSSVSEDKFTGVQHLTGGCSTQDCATEENILASSTPSEIVNPTLPPTRPGLLHPYSTVSRQYSNTRTAHVAENESSEHRSNSPLHQEPRTPQLPGRASPSVFIIGGREEGEALSSSSASPPPRNLGLSLSTRRQEDAAALEEASWRRSSWPCLSRRLRLTLLLLSVTVVFVLSWIPPYLAMVWYFYIGYKPPLSAAHVALWTYGPSWYVLNHFTNPLLYLALSSYFRQTVRALWRRQARGVGGEEVGNDITAGHHHHRHPRLCGQQQQQQQQQEQQ